MTISISRNANNQSEIDSKPVKVLESLPTRKAISQIIRDRIIAAGDPFFANDTIAHHISDIEREELKREIEGKMQSVFDSLIIDTANDHNTKETAKRVAKMYVDEVFKGRYHPMPKVTDFPNAKELDEIYTLDQSQCDRLALITLCRLLDRLGLALYLAIAWLASPNLIASWTG